MPPSSDQQRLRVSGAAADRESILLLQAGNTSSRNYGHMQVLLAVFLSAIVNNLLGPKV
jgi:hypothetical protein